MWSWDQGRLDYFQFDNLKKLAKLALSGDLRLMDRGEMVAGTGLPFLPDDEKYKPWRNYGRVFRSALLCVPEEGGGSKATKVAKALAADGSTTADEYFHYLSESYSDPSPALHNWDHSASLRYPLLFSLKYLLARAAIGLTETTITQIIAAYACSGFVGDEDESSFIELIKVDHDMGVVGEHRQAAESIRVIAQISYLSLDRRAVTVSLSREDAGNIFRQLSPIGGEHLENAAEEILRITELFPSAVDELELDYATTAVSDVEEAGFSVVSFAEGVKTRKTHIVIERNSKIRSEFFKLYPVSTCDFCSLDTAHRYPWVSRVLDVHHLLPLCSGSRTSRDGTMLNDLVAVCPTCHRAVHRYYDCWLKEQGKKDFLDAEQARAVYEKAKKLLTTGT